MDATHHPSSPEIAMMKIATLAALLLLVPTIGLAQSAGGSGPERGAHALEFRLPSGGATGTVWRAVSEELLLGLRIDVGLTARVSQQPDIPDNWIVGAHFAVGPAMKRYLRSAAPVRPYWSGNLSLVGALGRLEDGGGEQTSGSVGLSGGLGVGVEWFPLANVGIGGSIGLRSGYTYSGARIVHDDDRYEDRREHRHQVSFGMGGTGLHLSIYF